MIAGKKYEINLKNEGIMIPEERRNIILDKLKKNSVCSIDKLKSELSVSRVTIQRDIDLLASMGLLEKIHGGIRLERESDNPIETRYSLRMKQNYDKKLDIAEKAQKYVKENSTIFIDSSTTGYYFAKEMFKRNYVDINLITTSPIIVSDALNYPRQKVVSTGGILRPEIGMLSGEWTFEFLKKVNIDSAFISAAGVSTSGGITSSDVELVNIMMKIFEKTHEVNLLVDSSKLQRIAMLFIKPIKDCKRIITDSSADKKTISDFRKIDEVEIIY